MLGIAGGLMVLGLLMGAITGSIWLLLIPATIGLLLAGIVELAQNHTISNWKLKQYPPYGY